MSVDTRYECTDFTLIVFDCVQTIANSCLKLLGKCVGRSKIVSSSDTPK